MSGASGNPGRFSSPSTTTSWSELIARVLLHVSQRNRELRRDDRGAMIIRHRALYPRLFAAGGLAGSESNGLITEATWSRFLIASTTLAVGVP